ncbi:MAG: HlyD family secretion protein [Bacteroidetes bacterium]|nr:MAG: HlyD family secretion protein [Bacteroidota bacterium]
MDETKPQGPSRKKKIRAYIALAVVIIAVLITGWYFYHQYDKYVSTDDAYIDSDRVSVSSKMLGRIRYIFVDEGDTVRTGQLLVVLDSTDLVAQKQQAQVSRAQAIAAVNQAQANLDYAEKNIRIQEIGVERAKEDLDRATIQYEGKVIPKEQFDHTSKAYEVAQAQLDASRSQLQVVRSQIAVAEMSIQAAESQIHTLETNLQNTRICAPGEGRIAKRWLLPGDIAQPGQSVLTITKDSLYWIAAFFEETKIGYIYDQQPANFTVDAFPGVHFSGAVYQIGTNTAAQFSLIPPNNAAGNFTKVTQRIPVKISIDSTDSPDANLRKRLISGMSVEVKLLKR